MISTWAYAEARRWRIRGSAARPGFPGQSDQLVQLSPEDDRHRRRRFAALVAEEGHGHRPPGVHRPDHVFPGSPGVGEEGLVEPGATGHLPDGADLNPGLVHGHQQEGDALVFGGVGIGAGQHEDPVGRLGGRGPDLLPVDHPLVTVKHRPGAEAGRGRNPNRAPSIPGTKGPGRRGCGAGNGVFWRSVAPVQQGVADHLDPEPVVGTAGRHPRPAELLGHHHRLQRRQPAAPILSGPRRGQQPVLVQRGPPLFGEIGGRLGGPGPPGPSSRLGRCSPRKARILSR